MNALKRVFGAPGLVVTLWALQLLVAWHLATPVRVAAKAAMGEYAWIDDGHLMSALVELFANDPAVVALMAENAIVASILGLVFWALAYGAVIRRLSGKTGPSELAAASVRFLPGVVAQTAWLGIVRAIPIAIAAAAATKLPALAVVIGVITTAITVVAADIARVGVVLHEARPLHPLTALRALRKTLVRPRLLAAAGALAVVQMLVPLVALQLVLSDAGGSGSIWLARLLAFGGLVIGLWRIALVVDATDGE